MLRKLEDVNEVRTQKLAPDGLGRGWKNVNFSETDTEIPLRKSTSAVLFM